MKNILFLFLFLVPIFLFAQYPTGTNKSRLGYQTTGDGLIWRGVAADTAIKPRTTANAYFQLDTVNRVLRRYIATQGSWQVVGATPDLSLYLLKSDTAAMLVKYIERGDTATMLARYIERGDTAAMLANYPTFGDVATSLGNYLPIIGGTLTGTGGAGFVGFPSQVSAPGTPASGLNVYAQGSSFNWKGTDGYERQFASTLTGGRTYTLPDVSGTFALGTGTANRVPLWTTTNMLGSSNIQDNNTAVSILNSKPFLLGQWTTAGRPSGTAGYMGWRDGTTLEWYNGTRWAAGLESTFNRGTSTRIPFFDANGQVIDNAGLAYNSSQGRLILTGNSILGTDITFQVLNSSATQLFTISNSGNIVASGHSTTNAAYSAYSGGEYRYNLFGAGNTDNPLTFYTNGGARGLAYGEFTLNNDFTPNAFVGGGILLDTRTSVAPLRFFAKNNSANPVDAMDIFRDATVGVGTLNTAITGSQFSINSTTRGFLPPRQTNAQRTAISSPPTGLQVFQTDGTEGYYVKYASAWKKFLVEGDAATTWLKTELEAGRDVNIAGISSTDFRIQNSRIQFDNKFKVGSDSSFVYDPVQDTLFIMGDGTIKGITVTPFKFLGPNNTSSNFKSQISLGDWESSRGWNLGVDANEAGVNNMYFYNNATGALPFSMVGKTVLVGNFDLTIPSGLSTDMHVRATLTDGFAVSNSALTRRWTNTGSILKGFKVGGITSFTKDINADTLYNYGAIQLDALGTGTAATLLGKTSTNEIVPVPIHTEQYFTVTSTSSPQTLSNTISDNLINQGGTQATFTLTFPASPVDGQVLKITYNNAITTLTLDGNGNTIVGSAVTTGVAGSQRAFKFYTGIGWIKLY